MIARHGQFVAILIHQCQLTGTSLLRSPIVTISIIGQDDIQDFTAHQTLLVHNSSYVEGAFRSNFKEAQTKHCALADVSIGTFEAFVFWLYFGKLFEPRHPPKGKPDSEKYKDRTCFTLDILQIANIWIFGDRIGAHGLRKVAINTLHQLILETLHLQRGNRTINIRWYSSWSEATALADRISCLLHGLDELCHSEQGSIPRH